MDITRQTLRTLEMHRRQLGKTVQALLNISEDEARAVGSGWVAELHAKLGAALTETDTFIQQVREYITAQEEYA